MVDYNPIPICFYTEKKVGHGEDAPSLLIIKEKSCAVGVFDGMGGAGAAICDSAYGDGHTKAYVSSRIIKDTVESFLTEHLGKEEILAEDLKNAMIERLKKEQETFPPKTKSMLRSKLVREYPTTMTLITLLDRRDSWMVDSYWAGDSHCYLWTQDGFFQISRDDLEENNDPMENLHSDSPISNCVCADRDFTIHHKSIPLEKEPIVILCATDGCFGYYQTPMHFEYVLKSCLQKAKDRQEWELLIKNEVLKVTGDDCSLSLVAKGFSSFEDLKRTMEPISPEIIELMNQEHEVSEAEKILAEERKKYEEKIVSSWYSYMHNYMRYIKDEEYGNA